MLSRLRTHLRHNLVGYLALFFALTGVAYAAGPLKAGDPAGGDLSGTYPDPSIAANAVNSGKVANGAITPAKLNAGLQFTEAGLANDPDPFSCPTNGWYNAPAFDRVGYARDPFGIVHLRGEALDCNSQGTPMFVLPQGFRPEFFQRLVSSTGLVQVGSNGNVGTPQVANGDIAALEGVTFRCGPSGQNGCP